MQRGNKGGPAPRSASYLGGKNEGGPKKEAGTRAQVGAVKGKEKNWGTWKPKRVGGDKTPLADPNGRVTSPEEDQWRVAWCGGIRLGLTSP